MGVNPFPTLGNSMLRFESARQKKERKPLKYDRHAFTERLRLLCDVVLADRVRGKMHLQGCASGIFIFYVNHDFFVSGSKLIHYLAVGYQLCVDC